MIPYLQGYTAPQRVRDNEVTLKAEMEFGFSSVKSDVDNCIKTTLDTMQSWFGFDDRIIFKLSAYKCHVKRGEDYFKIKLKEIKETTSGSTDDT
jgi:Holliday junction resolvase RusA-like endonuclease